MTLGLATLVSRVRASQTDLELANVEAWRCLGEAQEGLGNHQDALNAFRKAKQHDPNDRTLDAAIDRSQKGIVSDFRNRYRK
jgi:tetratricopeptide (TPR) repeat protein